MLERLERAWSRPWELIRGGIKLWRHDRRATFPIPLRTRLSTWLRGFPGECHLIYGLDRNRASDYLPEYHRVIRTSRINRRPEVLHDKLLFEAFFKGLLPVPATLAWISAGRIVPLVHEPAIASQESLMEVCRRRGRLALKPFGESGGIGFRVLAWERSGFSLNGAAVSSEQLAGFLQRANDYLVTEFVPNGDYAARVFPHSTNTLRILTMRHPLRDRRAFVAIAVHRFGSQRAAPTDSFQRGGLAAEVDPATGFLKKATTYPRTGLLEWFSHHPETGARIEGLQVPNWERVIESLLAATEAFDFLDYVGWDVLVREDGFSVLEGNNHSGMIFLQVHRPLLADERVRAFYEHHGVIRRRRR